MEDVSMEKAELSQIVSTLQDAGQIVSDSEFRGDHRVVVQRAQFFPLMRRLRNEFDFDMLTDVTCVDYLSYPKAENRFGLLYSLFSTVSNQRIFVRLFLNESDLEVPSLVPIWEGANWLEREVWDMFGIRFRGHPDLRRILLPEAFESHPLRKDYPLQGRGERHHFPVLRREES